MAAVALASATVVLPVAPAAAAETGRVLASPCLNLRAGPSGSTALIGCIPVNTTITIDCVATGNAVTGPYGTTTLWDHTSYAGRSGFVSDAWVYTGTSKAVAGVCGAASAPAPNPAPAPSTGSPRTSVEAQLYDLPQRNSRVLASLVRNAPVTMQCWADFWPAATFSYSSPRWFKVTAGGAARAGWLHSSVVTNQRAVPACIGLPFAVNGSVKWTTSGTHSWRGDTRSPRGHIDFSGGDGVVRAAGDGNVHFLACSGGKRGLLSVNHGSGLWTTYYHINVDPGIAEGARVTRGTRLGTPGTNLPCGGSAPTKHVHFGIWRLPVGTTLNFPVQPAWNPSLNGKDIGGWIVADHATNYWSRYLRVPDGAVQESYQGYALLTNSGRLTN